jgi:hypothetical protein
MGRIIVSLLVLFTSLSCGPSKEDATTIRERENRDRAQQVYARLQGLYRGFITPNSGDRRPQPVEIDLRVTEVRDGVNENNEPVFRLELRGYFHPTDYDLGIAPIARRPVSARYYEDRNMLSLTAEPAGGRIPDQGRVSITVSIEGEDLNGTASYVMVTPVDGTISVRRYRK